jgi:hypothetical protein
MNLLLLLILGVFTAHLINANEDEFNTTGAAAIAHTDAVIKELRRVGGSGCPYAAAW